MAPREHDMTPKLQALVLASAIADVLNPEATGPGAEIATALLMPTTETVIDILNDAGYRIVGTLAAVPAAEPTEVAGSNPAVAGSPSHGPAA